MKKRDLAPQLRLSLCRYRIEPGIEIKKARAKRTRARKTGRERRAKGTSREMIIFFPSVIVFVFAVGGRSLALKGGLTFSPLFFLRRSFLKSAFLPFSWSIVSVQPALRHRRGFSCARARKELANEATERGKGARARGRASLQIRLASLSSRSAPRARGRIERGRIERGQRRWRGARPCFARRFLSLASRRTTSRCLLRGAKGRRVAEAPAAERAGRLIEDQEARGAREASSSSRPSPVPLPCLPPKIAGATFEFRLPPRVVDGPGRCRGAPA